MFCRPSEAQKTMDTTNLQNLFNGYWHYEKDAQYFFAFTLEQRKVEFAAGPDGIVFDNIDFECKGQICTLRVKKKRFIAFQIKMLSERKFELLDFPIFPKEIVQKNDEVRFQTGTIFLKQ